MPYIPLQHQKYNLLPLCQEQGGEVFSYPFAVNDIGEIIGECLIPYGYDSYEDYYSYLDELIQKYGRINSKMNAIGKKIDQLKTQMRRMNKK